MNTNRPELLGTSHGIEACTGDHAAGKCSGWMKAGQITPDDIYALGLAVGNILRDVDPAKRDQVLELIRTLERQAKQ